VSTAVSVVFGISIFVVVATLAAALTLESHNRTVEKKKHCGCRKHG
jgi:uncharacterized protein YqhQ